MNSGMPRAILLRNQGTAFTMTRGPALIAQGPDQLLIFLQVEGSCDSDCGGRRGRIEPGDVAIMDYARPFRSAVTDYENLMILVARENVPAALLAIEPHGLVFPRGSGAARLIGAALKELYCTGRRSDGERSRGGDRGHHGADDRLRARKAGRQ